MKKPIQTVIRDVRLMFVLLLLALAGLVASTAHAGGVTILTAGFLTVNGTNLVVSATTSPTGTQQRITSAGNVAWVVGAPSVMVNGQTVFVSNVDSADTITITVGTTVVGPACAMAPGDNAIIEYDNTTTKWRVLACNTAAGGTGAFWRLAGGSDTVAADYNLTLTGGVNGLSFDGTTLTIDAFNHRVGFGTATPGHKLTVIGGTLTDAIDSLYVDGTTSSTAGVGEAVAQMTSTPTAAAENFPITLRLNMLAGYTGTTTNSRVISAFNASSMAVGASGMLSLRHGGVGVYSQAVSSSTGGTAGVAGEGRSTGFGVGVLGFVDNDQPYSLGVFGNSINATGVQVGGLFLLGRADANDNIAVGATSAALIADNGAIAADIFVARDSGTAKVTIANGGATTITTTLAVNGNATLGDATSDLTTLNGDVKIVAGSPTFTTGTCTATSGTGNDIHGTITGTCTSATAIVHYSSTKSVAPDCQVTPKNAAAAATNTTMSWVSSTTDLTITQVTATTAGIWGYSCFQ